MRAGLIIASGVFSVGAYFLFTIISPQLQPYLWILLVLGLVLCGMGIAMRAGLIKGSLFLMFVGLILMFIGSILYGALCVIVGFVMLIVGLFTSRMRKAKH